AANSAATALRSTAGRAADRARSAGPRGRDRTRRGRVAASGRVVPPGPETVAPEPGRSPADAGARAARTERSRPAPTAGIPTPAPPATPAEPDEVVYTTGEADATVESRARR